MPIRVFNPALSSSQTPTAEALQQERQTQQVNDQYAENQDFIAKQQQEQAKAQRAQEAAAADAEQDRKHQIANAKRAGVQTRVDPATGQEDIQRHDDGAPVYQAGFVGKPQVSDKGGVAKYRDARGSSYEVPFDAIKSEQDPSGETFYSFDVAGADGTKQTFRQPAGTKPLFRTDPTTGNRLADMTDPTTGSVQTQVVGIDRQTASKAEIAKRRDAIQLLQNEISGEAAMIAAQQNAKQTDLGREKEKLKAAQDAYDKIAKGKESFEQAADGLYAVTSMGDGVEPLRRKLDINTDAAAVAKANSWLKSKESADAALTAAKAAHDPLDAEVFGMQKQRDQLAIRLLEEKRRGEAEIRKMDEAAKAGQPVYEPEWQKRVLSLVNNPRVQDVSTVAELEAAGDPIAEDVKRVALPETNKLINSTWDAAFGPQSPIGQGILRPGTKPSDATRQQIGEAQTRVSLVDGLTAGLTAGKPATVTDSKAAKELATKSLGMQPDGVEVSEQKPEGHYELSRNGETFASLDPRNNRLTLLDTPSSLQDKGAEIIANASPDGVPVYMVSSEQPYKPAEVHDLIQTGINAARAAKTEEETASALADVGLDSAGIRQKVMAGKLSVQDGKLLNDKLNGVQQVNATAPAVQAEFGKWLAEPQNPMAAKFRNGTREDKAAVVNQFMDGFAAKASNGVVLDRSMLAKRRDELLAATDDRGAVSKALGYTGGAIKNGVASLAGIGYWMLRAPDRAVRLMGGTDDEGTNLIWNQSRDLVQRLAGENAPWNKDASPMGATIGELQTWADRADSVDDMPDELADKLAEQAFTNYHGFTAGSAADVDTTRDTFNVKKNPQLRPMLEQYLKTGNGASIQGIYSMLKQNARERQTGIDLNKYVERPRTATAADAASRAQLLGIKLDATKATAALNLAGQLENVKDAKQYQAILKQAATVLGLEKPEHAALALSEIARQETTDPESFAGAFRGASVAGIEEVATEVVSDVALAALSSTVIGAPEALALKGAQVAAKQGIKGAFKKLITHNLDNLANRSAKFAKIRQAVGTGRAALGRDITKLGDEFQQLGIQTPKFGQPLTTGQKAANFAVGTAKATIAGAPIEAMEEGVTAWLSNDPSAANIGDSILQGALGVGGITPAFAGVQGIRNAFAAKGQMKEWEKIKGAYVAEINANMGKVPGFKPLTTADFDAWQGLQGSPAHQAAAGEYVAAKREFDQQAEAFAQASQAGPIAPAPSFLAAKTNLEAATQNLAGMSQTAFAAMDELRAVPDADRPLYTAAAKAAAGATDYTEAEAKALMQQSGANAVIFQQATPLPAGVQGPVQVKNLADIPTVTQAAPAVYRLPDGVRLNVPAPLMDMLAQKAPSMVLLAGNPTNLAGTATTPANTKQAKTTNDNGKENDQKGRQKGRQTLLEPDQPTAGEAQTSPAAQLPNDLKGAKPRYNYGEKAFELEFQSDFDRAAYIAAQDKPSKSDADYVAWAVKASGMDEAQVRAHGQKVRAYIKEQAASRQPGVILVPSQQEKASTPKAQPKPAATKPAATTGAQATNLPPKAIEKTAREAIARVTGKSPKLKALIKETKKGNKYPTGGFWMNADGSIAYHMPTLIQDLSGQGFDAATIGKRVMALLDEEIRHSANMEASRRLFESERNAGRVLRGMSFESWRDAWYGDIWNSHFTDEMRAKVQEAYGATLPEQDWMRAMEGLRMLDQLRATGSITEAVLRALDAVIAALRDFLDLVTAGGKQVIEAEIKAMQEILAEYGYENGTVQPAKAKKKASTPKAKEAAKPADKSKDESPMDGDKKPWQMTRAEFIEKNGRRPRGMKDDPNAPKTIGARISTLPNGETWNTDEHGQEVYAALLRGENVPADVMAEYPMLQDVKATTDQTGRPFDPVSQAPLAADKVKELRDALDQARRWAGERMGVGFEMAIDDYERGTWTLQKWPAPAATLNDIKAEITKLKSKWAVNHIEELGRERTALVAALRADSSVMDILNNPSNVALVHDYLGKKASDFFTERLMKNPDLRRYGMIYDHFSNLIENPQWTESLARQIRKEEAAGVAPLNTANAVPESNAPANIQQPEQAAKPSPTVPGATVEASQTRPGDNYPYPWRGVAYTNEGGRLAVDRGGPDEETAKKLALELLAQEWQARESRRKFNEASKPAKPAEPSREEWQKTYSKFKRALAKAVKAEDYAEIIRQADAFQKHYEADGNGGFPDTWGDWERHKSDAEMKLARQGDVPLRPLVVPTLKPTTPARPAESEDAAYLQAQKDAREALGGLFSAPAFRAIPQLEVPAERFDAVRKAAVSILNAKIRTPEDFARFIDDTFPGGKARPYSEAIWDMMGIADKSLRGSHDWSRIYGAIDKPLPDVQEPEAETLPDIAMAEKGGERRLTGAEAFGQENVMRLGGKNRARYLPAVWQMFQDTYRAIGHQYADADELIAEDTLWDVVLDPATNQPIAFNIAKISAEHGYKAVAFGSDGGTDGKLAVRGIIARFNEDGYWAELSDAPAHIARKTGIPVLPAEFASALLGKPVTVLDESTYERWITGLQEPHIKTIFGKPWNSPQPNPSANKSTNSERGETPAQTSQSGKNLEKPSSQSQWDGNSASQTNQPNDTTQQLGGSGTADSAGSEGSASDGIGRPDIRDVRGGMGTEAGSGAVSTGKPNGGRRGGGKRGASSGGRGNAEGSTNQPEEAGADSGSGVSPGGEAGSADVRKLTRPPEGAPDANFVIKDDFSLPSGPKARIDANLQAIRLLREIEKEERNATEAEKAILAKYSGWGSFKNAFNQTNQTRWEQMQQRLSAAGYNQRFTIENSDAYLELAAWRDRWGDLHDQLTELLEPDEFRAMSKSILNAHYTSLPIIDSMWKIVDRLGFKGGKVLETSVGGGYFVGRQPKRLADKSEWNAVELDEITSRIFSKLYPEARINGEPPKEARRVNGLGFQQSSIPNNSIDLVIGNFPFDDLGPNEATQEFGMKMNLHNYFFARSLDKVRPGGLVVAITSASTMDNNLIQRELLAGLAELVASIRLPNTAFKDSAGTEVTTDIIILRKKDGSRDVGGEAWLHTAPVGTDVVTVKASGKDAYDYLAGIPAGWVPVIESLREPWAEWRAGRPRTGEKWKNIVKALKDGGFNQQEGIRFTAPIEVNQYFENHPEMVMGKHALARTMYSAGEYAVIPDGSNLLERIDEAISKLPENVFGENVESELEKYTAVEDQRGDREGSTIMRDGKVYQVIKRQLVPVRWDVDILDDIIQAHDMLKGKGTKALRDEVVAASATMTAEDLDKYLRKLMKEKLTASAIADIDKKIAAQVAKRTNVFASWVTVRDAARELVNAELDDLSDEKTEELRQKLNETYDAHVAKFGAFGKRGQNPHRFLDDDEDTPLLDSLEDEELVSTDAKGKPVYRYVKRPIFSKAQLSKTTAPESAESIEDAVGISIGYLGRLSVPYMAKLLGTTETEAVSMLAESGLALVNPKTGLYETADMYLSGEVRAKLREAEKANLESGGQYTRNVELLKAVMPANRPIQSISINMGARWVPGEVYTKFAQSVLGLGQMAISYQPAANIWRIEDGGSSNNTKYASQAVTTEESFETNRVGVGEIIDSILNKRQIAVYDTVGRDQRVFNAEATIEAKTKADQMAEKFNEWVKSSDSTVEVEGEEIRVGDLAERLYNENVAGVIPPNFKGDWVTLPGQSGEIWLKPHRKAVLARMLTLGYGMMAHGVGSGKTYNQIALAMELRRLGKARKVMTLVQNSTIKQFAASHMKAYPQSRILVADEKNFTARKRAKFQARIATGDYDSIILTHSNVALIGHDEQAIRNYMARAFDQLTAALADAEDGSTEQRDIQKAMDKLQEKLDKMLKEATSRAGGLLTWEQLGIDALIVDEAHAFKNAPIVTRMARVKNLPNGDGSAQAIMMQMKVSNVQATTGGKNIFFATGTPITNTMAEAYTMLNFIAPMLLEQRGIRNFDDFATTFGRTVSEPEATWKGEIENVERFAKFINGPELVNLIRSVFDVALGNESMGIRVPRIKGGKPRAVLIEPTEASEIFNDWIIDTAAAFAAIPNKRKAFEAEPWLSAIPIMTMQAGMAQAIDPRLINPNVPDDPESKVNKTVEEVVRIYKQGEKNRTAQVIFSDLSNPFSTMLLRQFNGDPFEEFGSVNREMESLEAAIMAFQGTKELPEADEREKKRLIKRYSDLVSQQFNLFEDIKAKLVAKGIPAAEIAIASADMDKKKLQASFEKVNSGQIRIIMGSTARLGVGVNIQERLAGCHNISPPRDFKPAMMEQRIGRIERQGNLHRDWADTAYIQTVEKYSKTTFEGKNLEDRYNNAVKWLDENDDNTGRGMRIRDLAEEAAAEFDVEVINYGLKLSMDSAVYSMMNAKQGFIEQVLMGENVLDEFDDPASEEAAGFALMAAEAMGNEDLKTKAVLDGELRKLRAVRAGYLRDQWNRKSSLESTQRSLQQNLRKDPAAIRAAGKDFEGAFERVKKEYKTTRGSQVARDKGKEAFEALTNEQRTEKITELRDVPVYRFGDEVIDMAKPESRIIEPLNKFIVALHQRAKDEGRTVEQDFFVNDARFVVSSTHAKELERATVRVSTPHSFTGGDSLYGYVSTYNGNPGSSLLQKLRDLATPGTTERYASSIEYSIESGRKQAQELEKLIANQKPFPQESEFVDKATQLMAVEARLRAADTNPRNHRYYRALKRIAGEANADAILGLAGGGAVPAMPQAKWDKIYVRLRIARRNGDTAKTPEGITKFVRDAVMGDVADASNGIDTVGELANELGDSPIAEEERGSSSPAARNDSSRLLDVPQAQRGLFRQREKLRSLIDKAQKRMDFLDDNPSMVGADYRSGILYDRLRSLEKKLSIVEGLLMRASDSGESMGLSSAPSRSTMPRDRAERIISNLAAKEQAGKLNAKERAALDEARSVVSGGTLASAPSRRLGRGLADMMPTKSGMVFDTIAKAYRAVQSGSSSQFVPIKAVFQRIKAANPETSPAAFMAEIQDADTRGDIMVEAPERPETIQQAGPFMVRNALGVPSTNMMVVDRGDNGGENGKPVGGDTLRSAPSRITPIVLTDAINRIENLYSDPLDTDNWPDDVAERYNASPLAKAIDEGDFLAAWDAAPESAKDADIASDLAKLKVAYAAQAKYAAAYDSIWNAPITSVLSPLEIAQAKQSANPEMEIARLRNLKVAEITDSFDDATQEAYDYDLDDAEEWLNSDELAEAAKEPFTQEAKKRAKATIAQIEATGRYTWDKAAETFDEVSNDDVSVLYAAPSKETEKQKQAREILESMQPIWRDVLQDQWAGKSIEDIADARNLSLNAVNNILYRAGGLFRVLMDKAAAKPLVQVEDGIVKAKFGRPDLAMSGNAVMAAVDQRRMTLEEVTHAEMQELAVRMFDVAPDDAEKLVSRYLDSNGTDMRTDGMSPALQAIVSEAQGRNAVQMLMMAASQLYTVRKTMAGKGNSIQLVRLGWAWRDLGTETARALSMRQDPFDSPEERAAYYLQDSLLTPPDAIRNELRRNPANKERILAAWAARADQIKKEMLAEGIDLDATFRELAKEQKLADETIPEPVKPVLARAPKKTRQLVKAILQGLKPSEAIAAAGLTAKAAFKAYQAFRETVNQAGQAAAKGMQDQMLRSAPAADFAANMGLPDLTEAEWMDAVKADKPLRTTPATEALKEQRERKKVGGEIDLKNRKSRRKALDAIAIRKSNAFDKMSEFWRASILSGPQTHVVNLVSGMTFGAYEATFKKMATGAQADIARMFGLKPDAASLSDVPAMLSAVLPSIKRAFLDGIGEWQTQSNVFDAYAMNLKDAEGQSFKESYAPALKGILGKIMRGISFRAMGAADAFVKSFFTRIEVVAQARQIARNENLEGEAFRNRIAELTNEVGSIAWERALAQAKRITFQNEEVRTANGTVKLESPLTAGNRTIDTIDGLAQLISRTKKGDFGKLLKGLAHFTFPFVDTPTNIFKQGITMSPIGGLLAIIDATRSLMRRQKGNTEEATKIYNAARALDDLTNQIVAWGFILGLSELVKPGDDDEELPWITGTIPWRTTSPGEREIAYRTAPPQSIRIDGQWVSYKRLDPFASSLAFTVDAIKEFQSGKPLDEAWGNIGLGLMRNMQDKTFLQGVSDVVNAIQDPERFGTKWATNIAIGFIPNLIRQPIRTQDPIFRESDLANDLGFWDNLGRRVGYGIYPQGAMPAFDIWGRESAKNTGTGGPNTDWMLRLLSPMDMKDADNVDALDVALLRYNYTHSDEPFGVTAPSREISRTISGKVIKVSLDDAEYSDFVKKAGQTARANFGDRYKGRDLTEKDVEDIKDAIQKVHGIYRDAAFVSAVQKRGGVNALANTMK